MAIKTIVRNALLGTFLVGAVSACQLSTEKIVANNYSSFHTLSGTPLSKGTLYKIDNVKAAAANASEEEIKESKVLEKSSY